MNYWTCPLCQTKLPNEAKYPILPDYPRKCFEAWITGPPYERDVTRFPNDSTKTCWPGNYKAIDVDLAWLAWQEAINTHTFSPHS